MRFHDQGNEESTERVRKSLQCQRRPGRGVGNTCGGVTGFTAFTGLLSVCTDVRLEGLLVLAEIVPFTGGFRQFSQFQWGELRG